MLRSLSEPALYPNIARSIQNTNNDRCRINSYNQKMYLSAFGLIRNLICRRNITIDAIDLSLLRVQLQSVEFAEI